MEVNQEIENSKNEFINFGEYVESRSSELESKTPYYMFVVKGPFAQGEIELLPPTSKRIDTYSKETLELIDDEWEKRLADAKANGRQLFNSPYLGFESFTKTPEGKLLIKTYETSYKEYVGLRFHQEIPYSQQANPISVGTLIVLKDGILVPQRGDTTEYLPKGLEIPAGWPSKQEVESGEFMHNPFVSAQRELEEETGIKPEEANLSCTGVILENHAVHPLILFEAKTTLTKEDVLKRKGDDESRMHFIDNTPEAVRSTLLRKSVYSIPPLPAALYNYGSKTFGEKWKTEVDQKMERLAHLLNVHVKVPGRHLKGLRTKV